MLACYVLPAALRVDNERIVTNRPLAGTRRRGVTPEADKALERELLADEKEVRHTGQERLCGGRRSPQSASC